MSDFQSSAENNVAPVTISTDISGQSFVSFSVSITAKGEQLLEELKTLSRDGFSSLGFISISDHLKQKIDEELSLLNKGEVDYFEGTPAFNEIKAFILESIIGQYFDVVIGTNTVQELINNDELELTSQQIQDIKNNSIFISKNFEKPPYDIEQETLAEELAEEESTFTFLK